MDTCPGVLKVSLWRLGKSAVCVCACACACVCTRTRTQLKGQRPGIYLCCIYVSMYMPLKG